MVKDTLSNFHELIEIIAPEDKKILLQLIISKIIIKDNKDIGSIELQFDERVQKYFINDKTGEPPHDGGSPVFNLFTLKI